MLQITSHHKTKRRFPLSCLPFVALLLSACNAGSHTEHKVQAEQRWNHVRARVQFQLAEKQYEGGLLEDSLRTVTESLTLDANQADAYALLAKSNLELGKIASAKNALDLATKSGADHTSLTYLRGVVFEQKDQPDLALREFEKAYQAEPTNIDYVIAYVECLATLGQTDKALLFLKNASKEVDDKQSVSLLAARLAEVEGDTNAVIAHLQSASSDPEVAKAVAEDLGVYLVRAKRHTDAIRVLEPFVASLAKPGTHGSARKALATALQSVGNPESARKILLGYAPLHPSDVAAQILLAKTSIETRDMVTALEAIDRAEQIAPEKTEVRFVRAVIQWRRGDTDLAINSLAALIHDNPNNFDACYLLGEIHLSLDDMTSARVYFRRALEINPTDPWAASALTSIS